MTMKRISFLLPILFFPFSALYETSKSFVTAQDLLTFGYKLGINNTKIYSNTGTIKFCARVATKFLGLDDVPTTVAFQETKYNIDYDITNQTYAINASIISNQIRDFDDDNNGVFSIQACQCNDTSFACTSATDIQPVHQDEWLHVCIKPNATNVNITNLRLTLTNPEIDGFQYKPIDFGTDTWRYDNLTEVDVGMTEGIDVVRAKVFLAERLFDAGNTLAILGKAFLSLIDSGSRKLGFLSFNLVVPFEGVGANGDGVDGSDYMGSIVDVGENEEDPDCASFLDSLSNFFSGRYYGSIFQLG